MVLPMTKSEQLEYKLEDVYYADDPHPQPSIFIKGLKLGLGLAVGIALTAGISYVLVMAGIFAFGAFVL